MDLVTLAGLAGLALIDSTSIGTLVIPIWMLLAPRVRASRFLIYLATVAVFYAVVGVILVLGAEAATAAFSGLADARWVSWVQLAAGVGLFAWSFRFDGKRRRGPGRADRWKARLTGENATVTAMIGLGVGAAALEVATMLPYLAAVGLITSADLPVAGWLVTLAGYVLVMILPALLLGGVRALARDRIAPLLERLSTWLATHTEGALGWVLGIAGFLLARDAAFRLGLFGLIDRWSTGG
ncbi:GAP family protein [Catenuloplanes japonicus]|uniref:GAP family protein n=1 Tax=Catenuloplanes japonicus TaxID=33876 RepID=UPI0005257E36|nr:GAP family protein [Catenuloplanes japonicus]